MLTGGTGDALLGNKRQSNIKQSQVSVNDQVPRKSSPQKNNSASNTNLKKGKKKKKDNSQFTNVLKFFNIIIGILLLAFGVYCYYGFNNQTQNLQFLGLILPGYIILSGLVILSVEMHIGFICRNMKFLYNYFGRGFFNIYAGIMPLALVDNNDSSKQDAYFKVIIYVIAALMGLIGALYIMAKVFCCAKQGDKRKKKRQQQSDSDSESEDSEG